MSTQVIEQVLNDLEAAKQLVAKLFEIVQPGTTKVFTLPELSNLTEGVLTPTAARIAIFALEKYDWTSTNINHGEGFVLRRQV